MIIKINKLNLMKLFNQDRDSFKISYKFKFEKHYRFTSISFLYRLATSINAFREYQKLLLYTGRPDQCKIQIHWSLNISLDRVKFIYEFYAYFK